MDKLLIMAAIEIIDFEPAFAPAFKALNEAWIAKHFVMEPKDHEMLGDPEAKIIGEGGYVFFAVEGGEALGCCALVPLPDGGFELIKMAVAEGVRGRGIGRALMQACVDRATSLGAPRIYLESGSALTPALTLYRAFGFVDLPPGRRPASPYARADVWMELNL